MNIDRLELQTKLQTVAPALADNDLVPVLTHYLFTGKRLLAYNDRIALSVPLDLDFKGTVEGKLMLDYVTMCTHAKTATLGADNGRARLALGKSQFRLETKPADAFTFAMPAMPKPSEGVLNADAFFPALDNCLFSTASSATVNEQLGVTFIPNGSKVRMFATDLKSLSYAQLPLPQLGLKEKAIVPTEFCRQMLALKDAQRKQLVMRSDHALFIADDTVLFGRVLRSDTNQINFDRALKNSLPANFPNGMAKMDERGRQHDRLKTTFAMAARLYDIKGNVVNTTITVRDNIVRMEALSPRGDARDQIKLDFHPAVEAKVNASLVKAGYDRYKRIQITDRCTLLADDADSLCIVTHMTT